MIEKISRHLYMIFLLLSCLAVGIYGWYCKTVDSELYSKEESAFAIGVQNFKAMLLGEEQATEGGLIDVAALGGESMREDDTEEFDEAEFDADYEEEYEDSDFSSDLLDEEEADEEDEVVKGDLESLMALARERLEEEDMPGLGDDAEEESLDDTEGEPEAVQDIPAEAETPADEEQPEQTKKKWSTVDESYFSDALFIGDSRQQGFGLYSDIPGITCYAQKSFQASMVSTKPLVETPLGKLTLVDALAIEQHKYGKVYIMYGLNDMGSTTMESMDNYFYNLIDYVKLTQPRATIYLESIIHVSAEEQAAKPIFSNDKIDERNTHLKKIAKKEGITYINLNSIFTDENNCLFAEAASDGVHLKAEYIKQWKEYLMTHVVYPEMPAEEPGYIELTPAQALFKKQLDCYYQNYDTYTSQGMDATAAQLKAKQDAAAIQTLDEVTVDEGVVGQ